MDKLKFDWIHDALSDLKVGFKTGELIGCVEPSIGNLTHSFSVALVASVLELPDTELDRVYPGNKCFLSFEERQELKRFIYEHLHSCSSCSMKEKQYEIENEMLEEGLRAICPFMNKVAPNVKFEQVMG